MKAQLRDELGDFSSIVCLKAIITGMEEALGEKATAIALIAAGRARGREIAKNLNLSMEQGLDAVTQQVSDVLGKDGTRLMLLKRIEEIEEGFRVSVLETVCSAGEEQGSERRCTFTLGAAQGVLEAITEQRYRGVHTESVLRGGDHDVFEYTRIIR